MMGARLERNELRSGTFSVQAHDDVARRARRRLRLAQGALSVDVRGIIG